MKRLRIKSIIAMTLAFAMLMSGCSKKTEETTIDQSSEVSEATTEVEETTETTAFSWSDTRDDGPQNTPTNTPTPTPFPVDSTTPELEGYNILWCDEFNGDSLNENLWNREVRQAGYTNEELQAYTSDPEVAYVQDGYLNLRAFRHEDENGNVTYTSGKINTHGFVDFTYGRVEIRAKVPEGRGLWPAAWLMPSSDLRFGSWPRSGEIDMVEILGNQTNITYSNIHYGNPHGDEQGAFTLADGSFSDDFHVFTMDWEPGEFRFYLDGELYHTINDWYTSSNGTDMRDYPAPFNQTFYFIFNLAVGGSWPGDPDETTDFDNAIFQVDYIRVYQRDSYDLNVTRPEVILRDPDETGNYIINGDLSNENDSLNDDTAWKINLSDGGSGSAEIANGVITMNTENAGNAAYSVQIINCGIPLENGSDYVLTFDIRADEDRTGDVSITGPRRDYVRYLDDTTMNITTDWQTLTYEFTMENADDAFARLEFALGATDSTASVQVRNVRLEKVD